MNRELTKIENKLWDIPTEFRNEKEEYLKDKYFSFSPENDYIYNLKTEKGMFNIGAGQLVVVE